MGTHHNDGEFCTGLGLGKGEGSYIRRGCYDLLLEEGCLVVEMECAALAACARKRGALFGQFLFTADSLANVHVYDARGFGMESHEKALLLGLDVLRNYKNQ